MDGALLGLMWNSENVIVQVRTEVSVDVNAPRDSVFAYATDPENFPKFFSGAGPIPAVTNIENTNGAETRAGTIRKITSADGAVMTEEMLEFDPPEHQRYKLAEGIKPPLSLLVTSGGGEWFFTESDGGTNIKWQFHFDLTNPIAYPLGALLVNVFFKKAMTTCLEGMKAAIESRAEESEAAAAAG